MSQGKSITKYIRISARKARLAADLIRGLSVTEAVLQLTHCNLKAGRLLLKTVNSAVSNAEMLSDARKDSLSVKEVRVDEGPTLKRSKSKNRGGRHPVLKRTSHFTVVVSTEE